MRGPGWRLLLRDDPALRRGVWARTSPGRLELCAGREGDDAYLDLRAGQALDEATLAALVELIEYGRTPLRDYGGDDEREELLARMHAALLQGGAFLDEPAQAVQVAKAHVEAHVDLLNGLCEARLFGQRARRVQEERADVAAEEAAAPEDPPESA